LSNGSTFSVQFDIARAPPEVLGLGIPSIWHDQGIEHVAALLHHGDSQPLNTTGCLLRDEMATLRLELGMPGHPFQHNYKRHHLCTTQVFLHISWEFCTDYKFILKDNQNQLDLRRVDD
jgi:hypothetical protein